MEQQIQAVKEIIVIYIKKAETMTEKAAKVDCIQGLFDYLSTAEVKSLIQTPAFAMFRNVLLHKIHEYKKDPYVIARRQTHHRLHTVLNEMFTYLVQDDSVPRRRSERQKKQAVERFQVSLAACPASISLAAELKYWNDVQAGTKLPKVSIKVLPRRSARLNKDWINYKKKKEISLDFFT